jgi:hypothetical protein
MEMRAPVMVRQGGQEVLRQLPPGFRFRPTDEEVVVQYLRRKALALPLPAAVIPDVHNLYSLDPWDIPGTTMILLVHTYDRPATYVLIFIKNICTEAVLVV